MGVGNCSSLYVCSGRDSPIPYAFAHLSLAQRILGRFVLT